MTDISAMGPKELINQDSTLVLCSNGRCSFTSNTWLVQFRLVSENRLCPLHLTASSSAAAPQVCPLVIMHTQYKV